jgi:hypothetical protein
MLLLGVGVIHLIERTELVSGLIFAKIILPSNTAN